jgi:hypothetical protein
VKEDRAIAFVVLLWIVAAVLNLAFWGFIVWAIYTFVTK